MARKATQKPADTQASDAPPAVPASAVSQATGEQSEGEAALNAAISDAIKDGAIAGLQPAADTASEGAAAVAALMPPYDGPVLVVTGPKNGRRRGGFHFPREETELVPTDFGDGKDAAERLLAILQDPALQVVIRNPDGSLEEMLPEAIDHLETLVSAAAISDEEVPVDLIASLLDEASPDA